MTRPPSLAEVGLDLRLLPLWRRTWACVLPFVVAALALALLLNERWLPGTAATVVLSFLTYGSVSHDLVHRTYRIPRRLNNLLLSAMEMTAARSGTTYRLAHLNHHRYYPTSDAQLDPEAVAAGKGLVAGVVDGPRQQFRLMKWAWRNHRAEHGIALAFEMATIGVLWVTSALLAIAFGSAGLLAYMALMTAGAWTIPLITVTIPHEPSATEPQQQTRAFRGWGLDLVAFGHLYHLEHHLYPSVPHQRWRELAERLDDYFAIEDIEPITLSGWVSKSRSLSRR